MVYHFWKSCKFVMYGKINSGSLCEFLVHGVYLLIFSVPPFSRARFLSSTFKEPWEWYLL
eukprot:jgi/Botrbrau1/18700/Bobra.0386s0026.1